MAADTFALGVCLAMAWIGGRVLREAINQSPASLRNAYDRPDLRKIVVRQLEMQERDGTYMPMDDRMVICRLLDQESARFTAQDIITWFQLKGVRA